MVWLCISRWCWDNPEAITTERVSRNLKMAPQRLVCELKEIAFAQRTTVNRLTGFTLAYLNLRRDVDFPVDNQFVCVSPKAGQRSLAKFA